MRRALALALSVALALAGCGSAEQSNGDTAGGAGAAAVELDGRAFGSIAVDGHALVPGTRVTIRFDDGVMAVRAGCNSLSGDYELADGELRWVDEPIQTLIGCEPALQRQDEWLIELLRDGVRVAADGPDGLRVRRGDVTVRLREGAAPGAGAPPPIAGTTWRLETIAERDGTASSVPADVGTPTLRIDATAGVAELFAGCNRGRARARLRDDGFVVLGPTALTHRACGPSAMRVEQQVTAVLAGRVALGFEGQRLVAAKGGRQLVFAAG